MTKAERRVKKYVDAWCDGKRVQWRVHEDENGFWSDEKSLTQLLDSLHELCSAIAIQTAFKLYVNGVEVVNE